MNPVSGRSAPPEREEFPLLAIGLRLGAMLSLSIMFATVKLLDARGVHLVEIIFYRQAVALLLICAWLAFTGRAASVRTKRLGAHISRATIGLVGMVLNFGSYILLPLTEATTIGFTMPIFGAILSAVLLGEATGIRRWCAVIFGFVGVVIMIRPDVSHFPTVGVSTALSASLITAVISILIRELGRTESAEVTVFWFTLLSMPPLCVAMVFYAQPHDAITWLLLILIGTLGGIAQLCMTSALRWAPVSVVLPMDYSTIVWATAFGWLIWNDWPRPTTFIGGALIIASGIYIAWREHVRGRPSSSAFMSLRKSGA